MTASTPVDASPGTIPMAGRQRFLAAAQMKPADVTPVWFMRQAGRSLPEYRALRERHDFMTVATTPELAAQATLMPVDRLGVDSAVLFADIMLPLACIGVPFEIRPGVGPVIAAPILSAADVDRLSFRPAREFPRAKALMYGQPELWHRLMELLTLVTVDYLQAQIAAGADAVQLFDSWLGLLDPISHATMVLPYTRRVFAEIAPLAPTIHFSTGTTSLLEEIAGSGCAVVSVDWRLPLDSAWERLGPDVAIQGNLDPALVLAPWPAVEAGVSDVLQRAGGRAGHIFTLGHGILPESDPDTLERIVRLVHDGA